MKKSNQGIDCIHCMVEFKRKVKEDGKKWQKKSSIWKKKIYIYIYICIYIYDSIVGKF